MSGVHIRTRLTQPDLKGKRHPRYLVYYRRGGRAFTKEYAGSFETKKQAETRRDLIAGELAAGRDPRIMLAALLRPESRVGLEQRWREFITSRIDVGESATKLYENARARLMPLLGNVDPATVTPEQIQEAIVGLADLQPNTINHYVSTLRQVFDYCDVVPNPARSRKLRLPSARRDEINPPDSSEWTAIEGQLRARSSLALRLMECCGLRVSEATRLEYGDVDFASGRIRIARARTKTTSGRRWLDVPDELMELIALSCPPEDRLRVKRVNRVSPDQVRYDLSRACLDAGVVAHGPHDLRHRRISLWIRLGIDGVTVKTWAGHANASMSLNTYGHVVIDPDGDRWGTFWRTVYARSGSQTRLAVERSTQTEETA